MELTHIQKTLVIKRCYAKNKQEEPYLINFDSLVFAYKINRNRKDIAQIKFLD